MQSDTTHLQITTSFSFILTRILHVQRAGQFLASWTRATKCRYVLRCAFDSQLQQSSESTRESGVVIQRDFRVHVILPMVVKLVCLVRPGDQSTVKDLGVRRVLVEFGPSAGNWSIRTGRCCMMGLFRWISAPADYVAPT